MSTAVTKENLARKRGLGQYFTPAPVADFMAGFFCSLPKRIELLDPGAGAGALTRAMVARLCAMSAPPASVTVTAFEIDSSAVTDLRRALDVCAGMCAAAGIHFDAVVYEEDFIGWASSVARRDLFSGAAPSFTTVIMNPPYRKIRSDSPTRWQLRSAGLETSNLYAGFLALAGTLLADEGELVAITPRSFCNGPYFRPFREQFLDRLALRRIHVFESRSAAFRADGVLQENVILHARKMRHTPRHVTVSSSDGVDLSSVKERSLRYEDVVIPGDSERFIHLTTDDSQQEDRRRIGTLSGTLASLGLTVSTGRVVDFRAKSYLSRDPQPDTAPLIYPCHFRDGFVAWPKSPSRKPNALVKSDATRDLLVPNETYVLVKRFSTKEERRRIVACVHDPSRVPGDVVGFENHLNYFHAGGRGLHREVARGLALFLNSSLVDSYFRQFNGHTQVNAADLRKLPYPSRQRLIEIGGHMDGAVFNQDEIDRLIEKVLFDGPE